jgi:hypothetical protein
MGITLLVEVKTDDGKESDDQATSRKEWRGAPWIVARSLDDILVSLATLEQRRKRANKGKTQ